MQRRAMATSEAEGMAATQQQLEAIKLIGDWSKWMATIEIGAIAAVRPLVLSRSPTPECDPIARQYALSALGLSVACFALSVWLIAVVLVSLPAAVQDIDPGAGVWERRTMFGLPGRVRQPMWRVVVAQFILFGVGISALGLGVILLTAGAC